MKEVICWSVHDRDIDGRYESWFGADMQVGYHETHDQNQAVRTSQATALTVQKEEK